MGYRLSKIYTRTGDDGTTGLGDGTRVPKDDIRVSAFGTIDELNSQLGVLLATDLPGDLRTLLTNIQHALFDVGGELCIPDRSVIDADDVKALERALDELNSGLAPLEDFILPGGTAAAAACHVARAVCRRAERSVVPLVRDGQANPQTLRYLNRLSDLLFVIARTLNARAGKGDVLWQSRKKPPA